MRVGSGEDRREITWSNLHMHHFIQSKFFPNYTIHVHVRCVCTVEHMYDVYVQRSTCTMCMYSGAHVRCVCTAEHMYDVYVQRSTCTMCMYSGAHVRCVCTAEHMYDVYVQWSTCTMCMYSGAHVRCVCTAEHMYDVYVQRSTCTMCMYSGAHVRCIYIYSGAHVHVTHNSQACVKIWPVLKLLHKYIHVQHYCGRVRCTCMIPFTHYTYNRRLHVQYSTGFVVSYFAHIEENLNNRLGDGEGGCAPIRLSHQLQQHPYRSRGHNSCSARL